MEKVVLKLKVGEQLRRVNLEERPVAIEEVRKIIGKLFPSLLSYSLFYQDEEGDRIIVETDLELGEALQVALLSNPKVPVIRLDVEEKAQPKVEPKKSEEESNEEQENEKKSLFTQAPKAFFLHPFALRCAKMVLENVEMVHGNAFLGPFVASWGALGHGSDFVRKVAQSVVDGVDCEIPEHVAKHPFFFDRCEWLQKNESVILKKFDKMEAGLSKLKETNPATCLPPDHQMMLLWVCDGDVDTFLSHVHGGASGPNINVQAPGFSYVHSSSSSPGASGSFSFSFGDGSTGSSSFSSSSSTTSSSSTHCSANVKITINGTDVVNVEGMSVAALKQYLREKNISFAGVFEKEELVSLVRDSVGSSKDEALPKGDSPKGFPRDDDKPSEQPPQQPPQKSKREEAIEALLVLGFSRSEIVDALDATNDDANLAADRLLGQ